MQNSFRLLGTSETLPSQAKAVKVAVAALERKAGRQGSITGKSPLNSSAAQVFSKKKGPTTWSTILVYSKSQPGAY